MNAILRPAEARGYANHGWLETRHTFSFAHYYDPHHMGFRSLRVINDDIILPGTGFPTHGHRDMEILSYIVSGELAHEDNTGGKGVLRRGDIQTMSAGTGIRHSEYNASHTEPVRIIQIWILPSEEGLSPAYDQRSIPEEDKRNRLALLAGHEGSGAVLPLHQDVRVYASLLRHDETVRHALQPGRGAWVQVVTGTILVNGLALKEGDGLALEETAEVEIRSTTDAEFLLFDLA